ncbi:MAG: TonB-dependent receptor [Ignavibacteriaceae bacterium]|nr:TonB-dependent receptor [Ignavibacteriaceae bacterium]
MKKIIILFLFLCLEMFPQIKSIKGIIFDSDSKTPLQSANILIQGTTIGTTSDENGLFTLNYNFTDSSVIIISFIGYKTEEVLLKDKYSKVMQIPLESKILPSQTILIEASVGKKGVTPISFEKILKEKISKDYIVQDVPNYLSQLPSTTFYSENGNGIGYNYLSIRGFDQRRISVSINGIPQNDPEDHNVYWLDFPDLLASTELLQVQRGSGSGVIGFPSVGGSINIITSPFSDKSKFDLLISAGSFNTKKYSASFASGLIDNRYSVYTKLSQISSSGYRNLSWAKLNSYHLSFVRYDGNLTTQLNLYGGPISDGLAYTGVAKFAVKDLVERKANYSYWEADENGYSYVLNRRPEEIENFSQPHFELLNEFYLNDNLKFNSALFYVYGSGYFDYDGSWSVYYDDYFRLKFNGFDSTQVPVNALIRAQVENKQFGWIPKLSFNHKDGQLIIGGEFRIHRSDHWGSIIYAENIPSGVNKDYKYYFYNGAKNIFSGFVHETYNLNDKINLLGELQLSFHKYKFYNERYVGNEFTIDNLFVNPRLGLNYKFSKTISSFISFARVTREPRLKNYYDAAEASGGKQPQFALNADGTYNFDSPDVQPETMNDLELGISYQESNLILNLNLYYMIFENEIIKSGKLDRFGQPVTGNVDKTTHKGAEFSFVYKPVAALEIFGNTTLSSNKINNGKYFINESDWINLDDNKIGGFPEMLVNAGIQLQLNNLFIKLNAKYVSSFYSDNFDSNIISYLTSYPGFIDYNDNVNDSYFTADFYCSYSFNFFESVSSSKIFLQVNNIFNNLYSAYAIGKEYFPAADRNFIAGIQLGL